MPTENNQPNWHLENTFKTLPETLYHHQPPVPVSHPEVVCFNDSLVHELGLGFLDQDQAYLADYLSGNKVPDGAEPLAQAYAGHQFGHFTMLGDGRAILLGEKVDHNGHRFDLQLKGAGRTPFSRGGDGRATLYSMLREYLISEAMHHLGIPTSRSLAVVATGDKVFRETVHNGAVLTRVAASHIRVGSFEYVRNYGSVEELQALTTYTINRHYPELVGAVNPPLALLKKVMHQQIDLVVNWMRVGFIHGVMNTDNMSIAGETIDYGPCAFMNAYNPKTVFSSVDTQGRYAFGNQPHMAQWNLTAFANALLPIIGETPEKAVAEAQEVIDGFEFKFAERWYAMLFGKLGIAQPEDEDKALVDRLLNMMETHRADYTEVFVALQDEKARNGSFFRLEEVQQWLKAWEKTHQRNEQKGPDRVLMNRLNPNVIPRNHWVEQVLEAATEGDLAPFNDLLSLLSQPYDQRSNDLQFQPLPEGFDTYYQTFCGT